MTSAISWGTHNKQAQAQAHMTWDPLEQLMGSIRCMSSVVTLIVTLQLHVSWGGDTFCGGDKGGTRGGHGPHL